MTDVQNDISQLDLANCDREPIHIPGRVQSHGVMLVLDESDLIILHASDNAPRLLGIAMESLLGKPLQEIIEHQGADQVKTRLLVEAIDSNPSYVGTVTIAGDPFHAILHRFRGKLFLELEPTELESDVSFHNLYSLVRTATGRLKGAATVLDLCRVSVEEIRRITGLDRVMMYRFDPDWNGLVVAEDKDPNWHSYFDLRFPASDIPHQARQLYLQNRLRLIADVYAEPSNLVPQFDTITGKPIDMSYAVLRSVSPIHIEYLRNMAVGASMSVSIVKDDKLWGLIACHHRTNKRLPYEVRAACEHLGEIVSLQLAAKEYVEGADYRITLKGIQSRLLAQMAGYDNFVDGLVHNADDLLTLANAKGCAVSIDGVTQLVGETPSQADVEAITEWLRTQHEHEDLFQTDHLADTFLPAGAYKKIASGILALSIPRFRKSFVVWFRPEIMQTVKWAGNPNKAMEMRGSDAARLHPRRSFETYTETVHGKSVAWKNEEIEAVSELRAAIVGIILRKAEELAAVNAELQRSNKELEAFSYSVSHDLRAPFRHIFGFSDLLQKRTGESLDDTSRRYINTIMDSARHAGVLVDSLLAFSHMGRTALKLQDVDMARLVDEVRNSLRLETEKRSIDWKIDKLPTVNGDLMMLKLAMHNLIDNALKYTRNREKAVVEIGCRDEDQEHVFWVKDNGVGFDMRFKDKLFGVFQRLHRIEDFEGTGIGLANVRRTVERHGGRTWAEGEPDVGATIYFTLPARVKERA